eukprot:COSAG01_NODE_1163_length_11454_cov_3.546808_13_plen_61_part_00
MWGPLLESPTIAQHRGLRAARARYDNGFLAARPQQEFVRGGALVWAVQPMPGMYVDDGGG